MAEDDVSEEREPTAGELLAWRRNNVFLPDVEATPEEFPCLKNVSAGLLFGGVVRPLEPAPPEYVELAMPHLGPGASRSGWAVEHAVGVGPVPAPFLRPG
jgi:hypothetical protein